MGEDRTAEQPWATKMALLLFMELNEDGNTKNQSGAFEDWCKQILQYNIRTNLFACIYLYLIKESIWEHISFVS